MSESDQLGLRRIVGMIINKGGESLKWKKYDISASINISHSLLWSFRWKPFTPLQSLCFDLRMRLRRKRKICIFSHFPAGLERSNCDWHQTGDPWPEMRAQSDNHDCSDPTQTRYPWAGGHTQNTYAEHAGSYWATLLLWAHGEEKIPAEIPRSTWLKFLWRSSSSSELCSKNSDTQWQSNYRNPDEEDKTILSLPSGRFLSLSASASNVV